MRQLPLATLSALSAMLFHAAACAQWNYDAPTSTVLPLLHAISHEGRTLIYTKLIDDPGTETSLPCDCLPVMQSVVPPQRKIIAGIGLRRLTSKRFFLQIEIDHIVYSTSSHLTAVDFKPASWSTAVALGYRF